MSEFKGRDLLALSDFDRAEIERIFEVAQDMEPIAREKRREDLLRGEILATLFFQPSTRTRLSFETAMLRLGGGVVGFADPAVSRTAGQYKETLADTARVIDGYVDIVAMRHTEVGAPAEYAKYAQVPVINGADGYGPGARHPTQALIDLYTIKKSKGRIDGLTVLISGDLNYRVNQSLGYGLAKFKDVTLYLLCPENLRLPAETAADFDEMGLNYEYIARFEDVAAEVDVIYPSGPAHTYEETTPEPFVFNRERLRLAKDETIVLHALPRLDEVARDLDETPHAMYFPEAHNGVPIRMALLALLLGAVHHD